VSIKTLNHMFVTESCVLSGKSMQPRPAPLQTIDWPAEPWRKIAIDIAGEFQVK